MVLILDINYINCCTPLQYTEKGNSDSTKIFNKFPNYIAVSVVRRKCFISNLKKYVIHKAFYSVEYMNSQYPIWWGLIRFFFFKFLIIIVSVIVVFHIFLMSFYIVLFLWMRYLTIFVHVTLLCNRWLSSITFKHEACFISYANVLDEWSAHRTDYTKHTQWINIHAPGRIRTHDRGRWAAIDLHLRQRGHWDRHVCIYVCIYLFVLLVFLNM
jgi:hypothetical protein